MSDTNENCSSCSSCYYCSSCSSCSSCSYCSSCYYSKGLRMSENMLFCVGDGKTTSKGRGYQKNYQIFNHSVTKKEFDKAVNSIPLKLELTVWIKEENMTKEEKSNNPKYKDLGGYLKVFGYEEAWGIQWRKFSKEERQKFLDLPHFDRAIFKEITGEDVEVSDRETIRIGDLEFDKEEVKSRLKDLKPVNR